MRSPHYLVLQRWEERYRRSKFPKKARFVLPYCFPNTFTRVLEKPPEDEKKMIEEWRKTERQRCNSVHRMCCGELIFRIGLLNIAGYYMFKYVYPSIFDIQFDFCAWCLWLLSAARKLLRFNMPQVYHIFEIVQLAVGEEPLHRQDVSWRLLFSRRISIDEEIFRNHICN
jgi:hypothetical protein